MAAMFMQYTGPFIKFTTRKLGGPRGVYSSGEADPDEATRSAVFFDIKAQLRGIVVSLGDATRETRGKEKFSPRETFSDVSSFGDAGLDESLANFTSRRVKLFVRVSLLYVYNYERGPRVLYLYRGKPR